VDARLHHLQGKAERVTDLLPLLQEFYRDKLAMLLQHQAGARRIAQYDVNNTYQYIVNRDETHLSWVGKAIADLGGTPPEAAAAPDRGVAGKGLREADAIREDAAAAEAFVDRWRPRVDAMKNARHAKMLRVILGEILEQKRSFDQALAGRTDLLGRRGEQLEASRGTVLPARWIE
jgi:hypothetical protein